MSKDLKGAVVNCITVLGNGSERLNATTEKLSEGSRPIVKTATYR